MTPQCLNGNGGVKRGRSRPHKAPAFCVPSTLRTKQRKIKMMKKTAFKIAIETLERELDFTHGTAVAYVRACGRCEYCGCDLIMSRQGYAIAEIDHLLPKSEFEEHLLEECNFVLSCRPCNGVKRDVSVLKPGETAEEMLTHHRLKLIERVRRHISKEMKQYNKNWRRVTEVLHEVWWMSRQSPNK